MDMKVHAKKSEGGKYAHINFKPPASAAKAAKRGLELRKKNNGQGGTEVGVARARDLGRRSNLSPETVRRMKAFFDRHQKNRKASGGKELAKDKGYIAWMLWGGDAGYSWAKKVVKQMDAAGKKTNASSDDHNYMTLGNLEQIARDALTLTSLLQQHPGPFEPWIEDKVSQAKTHLNGIRNFIENKTTDIVVRSAKEPWEEKPTSESKLSDAWKAKAKARAKKAGRPYPNKIDNMWAAQQQKLNARVATALRAAAGALMGRGPTSPKAIYRVGSKPNQAEVMRSMREFLEVYAQAGNDLMQGRHPGERVELLQNLAVRINADLSDLIEAVEELYP